MSDKKRYTFNKISRQTTLTNKVMELPRNINSDEISSVITRGCKSTNHIKRFRNLDSFTPSPPRESASKPEKQAFSLYKPSDFFVKSSENAYAQSLGTKISELKEKNFKLKCDLKDQEKKYKSQLLIIKRDNEKLVQNIKLLKKTQIEDKIKNDELVYLLKKEVKAYKDKLELVFQSTKSMIEKMNPCAEGVKKEFNSLLALCLNYLSSEFANIAYEESTELLATGGFQYFSPLAYTEESFKENTKEAIVMKSYIPKAHGELELKLGDRIIIFKSDEQCLWLGRVNDKVGLFPSSHVMLD